MPQLRPYRPTDREDLYEVCLLTGDDGADASALYSDRRLLGEVYVGPYLSLLPELAWVVADDTDRARGYVLGATDTAALEQREEAEWWPGLRARYPRGAFPAGTSDAEIVEQLHVPELRDPRVLEQFPAHLHIDLLPEVQGGGIGRRLIETLLDALRERGVSGVHLGVSPTNTKAIGFYTHLGFEQSPDHARDDETIMTKRL